jgi:Flp pilus assembly protein TadG
MVRAREGSVAIYAAILLPMLIGGALLTVDAARLYSMQTFLQAGADAFALAGAAELDGQSQPNGDDSITRADRAIANLVTNYVRLGDAGKAAITVASTTYLSSLPASDASAITNANITTDATQARYVQVKVASANFTTFFPATFLGALSNTTKTSAIATAGGPAAGNGRQLCLGPVVPMFVCNPYEGNSTSIYQAVDPSDANYATNRHRQIKLRSGSGTFFPGNFGWLDTPELGNGANALRDSLALVEPIGATCQVDRTTVSQNTGNVTPAQDALNTRFDLWNGPYSNASKNASYAPALNVRKGAQPGNGSNGTNGTNGACNPQTSAPNLNSLPRDASFTGLLGSATWNPADTLTTYWTTNYGGSLPSGLSGSSTSRYDVYRYELAKNKTSVAAVSGPAAGEVGAPMCYSGGATATYDRRVLYVALINCTALNVTGSSGNLGVPFAYGKFFLTEPVVVSGAATEIYAELVGLVGTGSSLDAGGDSSGTPAVTDQIVQLYK